LHSLYFLNERHKHSERIRQLDMILPLEIVR